MTRFAAFLAASLFLALGLVSPAMALTSDWQDREQASARIIASNRSLDQKTIIGLQFRLQPHWHIYWRSPGDAGLPPQIDWTASENLASAELQYPVPKLESMQGLNTYGYSDEVVFPLTVVKKEVTAPLKLAAKMNVLICSDICVPVAFDIALNVPAGFETADEEAALLDRYSARVPSIDNGQGFSLVGAALGVAPAGSPEGSRSVSVTFNGVQPMVDAEIIAEVGDGSTLAISNTTLAGNVATAQVVDDEALKASAGKELIFTLIDKTNNQAVEKKLLLSTDGTLVPGEAVTSVVPETTAPMPPPGSLGFMIVFALLGGLILNLMPCVLPVLALKSLSFVSHGGGTPSGVRLSFLSTSLGIIFSFLVMAAAIIGLKEAGMSVGWGVQFQHPAFLIGLIVVLLAFAANLWGFFEIPLPRFLADRLTWTQGHGNLVKDFFSGAFATLLATPCTAPFLGTAIGFALAGGPVEILAIFVSLGIGLAAPFILIALVPKIATWLPKPGNWMNVVRKVLAVALLATAGWLVYVLLVQTNAAPNKDAAWADFDRSRIASEVAQGKVVFVDVTAEWCLTCKANKKFVLDRDDVKPLLQRDNIVLMRADWTKPDETIAAYLKEYGRFGIPFNIIYSQAQPQGYVLPELLTKEAVLDGLSQAEGK